MRILPSLALLSAGLLAAAATPTQPENGVTDTTVSLGQSCALKGPAAGLGKGMSEGLNAYFEWVNTNGGIDGRTIELTTLNDGYEPDKCKLVTTTLIKKLNVFALIGEVGTPTSKVAVPIAEENGVPFLAPFTGAEFLRNPHKPYVVNMRASYYQEMERLTQHLVDANGKSRIACFYQNDGYGQAGLSGIKIALEKRGMELASTGTYERNTTAVASGLTELAAGNPDAIVMVGAYKPCAAFIKLAKRNDATKDATFCNISFVGTKNLLGELGDAAEGCIVSQCVPYPWDTEIPLVKEFHKVMTKTGRKDDIGFVTLEGFMAGKLFCSVLDNVEGELTRESYLASVVDLGKVDLGGLSLNYGEEDNQGMDNVYLTVFRGGEVQPLD
jgi:ABC-type branched-subunit amino acid transport system substrate-binding protein